MTFNQCVTAIVIMTYVMVPVIVLLGFAACAYAPTKGLKAGLAVTFCLLGVVDLAATIFFSVIYYTGSHEGKVWMGTFMFFYMICGCGSMEALDDIAPAKPKDEPTADGSDSFLRPKVVATYEETPKEAIARRQRYGTPQ